MSMEGFSSTVSISAIWPMDKPELIDAEHWERGKNVEHWLRCNISTLTFVGLLYAHME